MKSLQMPFRYIQGQGLINELLKYTYFYGNNYAFITDEIIEKMIGKKIEKIFKSEKNKKYSIFKFEKDCTQQEIDKLLSNIDENNFDIIVGVGGGKSLDIAKIIASTLDKTLVIMPTTASNDSATSALSVLYKEDGTMEKYIYHNKNPHLVLISY
jgi:glycerol dehydrogenase